MTTEELEVFAFAQRAQSIATVFVDPDELHLLSCVCALVLTVPRPSCDRCKVAMALILSRIAEAFCRPQERLPIGLDMRVRRVRPSDVHLARALQCTLNDFPDTKLTLKEVARRCGLSVPYLSQLFSDATGFGFRRSLSVVRLLHAAQLLTGTTLSMKEVSVRVGYETTPHLDLEFRKRIDMTPGEFRRWTL